MNDTEEENSTSGADSIDTASPSLVPQEITKPRQGGFPIALSPADSDALYHLRAVAAFCCMTPGQAKPFVDIGIIPTFRLPGSQTICASKSAIREAWRLYEADWHDRHPIDLKEKLRQRKQKQLLKRKKA
jgi:hypothetical protein